MLSLILSFNILISITTSSARKFIKKRINIKWVPIIDITADGLIKALLY